MFAADQGCGNPAARPGWRIGAITSKPRTREMKGYRPVPITITDVIPAAALIISFLSFIAAVVAARTTITWTLRNQLADATSRMVQADVAGRDAEIQMASDATSKSQEPPLRTKRMISEQLRYASAAQAASIMKTLRKLGASNLISVQDNSITARSLSAYDDPRAETFWRDAIRGARGSGLFELYAQRDYAKFLFTQGEARVEDGRSAFDAAIKTAPPTDRGTYDVMWVYIELARSEKRAGHADLARHALIHAQEAVDKLRDRKQGAQEMLSQAYKEIVGA